MDIKSKNTSNLISLSFKVPFERFFHIFCNIWFKKIENWVRTCPHIGDIFIFTIKDIMYVPLLKIKLFKEQKESKNNKDYKYLYKEKRREVWNHILLSLWIWKIRKEHKIEKGTSSGKRICLCGVFERREKISCKILPVYWKDYRRSLLFSRLCVEKLSRF